METIEIKSKSFGLKFLKAIEAKGKYIEKEQNKIKAKKTKL